MKKTNRVLTSKKNILYGVLFQFLTIIMSFVVRSFFIRSLGNEILGLDGLFKNILSLMSFTELGIGVAISSSLYEPLATNNYDLIKALISLLKRFYTLIILIILVFGLGMTFFLPQFINGPMPPGTRIAFILYFLNSAATYMLVVNRTLLIADQRSYINSINQFIFLTGQQVIQIFFLVAGFNYVVYLTVQLIATILSNISLAHQSNEMYPYLKEKSVTRIPKEIVDKLKQNIIGMISAKFGGIVLTSTDNMVLSMFVNLGVVGNYSNYTTVVNGLTTLVNTGINAIAASIGNLGTEKNSKKEYNTYFQLYWGNVVLIINICIGMYFFFDKFIDIWVGEEYQLTELTTVAIIFLFFQNQIRQISIAFEIAHSLFWQQRYKSIIEALVNLIFSVTLVKIFHLSILGVVSGTILSNLLINSWWEPLIVFKSGIHEPMKKYWISFFSANFLMCLIMFLIHITGLNGLSITALIIRYLIFTIVFNVFVLITIKDFRKLILRVIKKA